MAGRLAELVPSGRIAVFLEGGYDLEALHDSAAATVRGLAAGPGDEHVPPPEQGSAGIIADGVARIAARHWDL